MAREQVANPASFGFGVLVEYFKIWPFSAF